LRRVLLLAAEKIFKNAAAARAAEDFAEDVERIVKVAIAETAAARAHARVERRVAVLVVGGAFIRVAQRLVSLAEFLEFFLRRMVARIFVRMKPHREPAVGFFDAVGSFLAGDLQNFVIIALGHFNSQIGRKI
jgi:hypothetical protein